MENKNYNALTEEFFNEFEAKTHKAFLTNKIFTYIGFGSILAAFISNYFEKITQSAFFGITSLISLALIITGIIGRKKTKENVNVLIDAENDRFYDEVYIQMVAGELDGEAISTSYTNTDFQKSTATPGDILDSKNVVISGTYKDKPYAIARSKATVVTEILYKESTGSVISYTPLIKEGPFLCQYYSKHDIGENTVDIIKPKEDMLSLYGIDLTKQNIVRMDNKNFKFQVRCNDAVPAYKFLTADVMESITEFNKKSEIHGISVTENQIQLMTFDKLINLDYSPCLKKSLKRNLKKLSTDKVLKYASEDAQKIKDFLENLPAASSAHTN